MTLILFRYVGHNPSFRFFYAVYLTIIYFIPLQKTIRDTLSSFQRTHIGQWHLHRRCFTEDQLNALSNMVLPPSHYV